MLVARIRDGDQAATAIIVERYAPLVERVAHGRLREPEDARDAAQEALARIVLGAATYRGEAAFAIWVQRVAVNACEDHARRILRRARTEVPAGAAVEAASDSGACARAMEASSDAPRLRATLATLSERQRRAIVLKDVLALRYEDVAEQMQLPVGTVKCHAHRGRKLLAARLRRPA